MLGWVIHALQEGNGWAADTQAQRIGVLGNIAYGLLGAMMLVILGLSIRNAIRNIKGSAGPVSFEASGGDNDPA